MTSNALVNFIWLPYGVLGIVLSAGLPFIIAFFFLESFESQALRKVGWIALIVVFISLAILRWSQLQGAGLNFGWIYVLIALISLLVLMNDGTIHSWFVINAMTRIADDAKRVDVADLTKQIREKGELLRQTSGSTARQAILREIKDLKNRVKDVLKS